MDSSTPNPKPHLLAIPFPVPGHVNPLMNLCYKIAADGIRVTFVVVSTTDSKPSRTTTVQEQEEQVGLPLIKFVSLPFPDGLGNNTENMKRLLNLAVENEHENEPITAVLADASVGWVLEIAERIGAQQFVFWNASPRGLVYLMSIPELNQESDDEEIRVNNHSSWMVWKEKMMANMGIDTIKRIQHVNSILTNAFCNLDSSSCKLIPKMLPIGPLITKSICSNSKNTIISQDNDASSSSSCLEWLDNKPNKSVVYVAFGGTGGAMSQCQFDKLALGLELSGQPYLWVVRPNNTRKKTSFVEYAKGYLKNGRILEWAPQEKVLAHPAIACFMTHCGWNSILEGISFGVPFLCWPNFGEQFFHQDYVFEILKVGLKIDVDLENGVRSRMEISNKIQMLLSNSSIKENALKLKVLSEESISQEGSSNQNLQRFINQLNL